MTWLWALLGLVVLQRLGELIYAQRNTARLLAQGGREHGARHNQKAHQNESRNSSQSQNRK